MEQQDMNDSSCILTSQSDATMTITLNRPDVRNAMSTLLIDELERSIIEAGKSEARTLVIEGTDPCFCAGMDLKTAGSEPTAMREMLHGLARVMIAIRNLEIPVIARVQGAAIGGGCGLMTACDFAITHPDAKLGYPEVDHGICPAVVTPWLVRKIGAGRARALLLMGGTITGAHALEIGLVTELAPREQLGEAVEALVERLAKGGRSALATTKRWLNEVEGSKLETELARGADLSADVLEGPEAQERLARPRKR